MQIEHKHIVRAARQRRLANVRILQTGIGKDAIIAAAAAAVDDSDEPTPSLIVLAGACGALTLVDDVPEIARVVDEHGHVWTPAFIGAHATLAGGVTLVAVDRIVSTPRDKRAAAERHGAAIVDMESHALAAWCDARGIAWTVVRGVSDTPEETLPNEVLAWISPSGQTRVVRAALDLVRKPWLVPHIAAVVRRSNRVLPKVGQRVCELAGAWQTRAMPAAAGEPS